MKRTASFLAVAVVLALVASGGALAKGPTDGSVEGPGLAAPIDLTGDEGSGPLWAVTEASGFFPSVFRQTPDPMLDARPAGVLGPRFVVNYVVPGPTSERDVLRQELYPYAQPAPVSYMAPDQPLFQTERTRGGWYVADPTLKHILVEAGLPVTAPTAGPDDQSLRWGVPVAAALLGALLAVALAVGVGLRRRHQPLAT